MAHELRDARDPGWYHIDNAVLDRFGPLIGANGIAVYNYLARKSRVTEHGRAAWPSYATIAEAINVSRPTAIAAVRSLEHHGLIRIQTVKEEGKRPFNRYTLVKVADQPAEPVNVVDQSTGKEALSVKNPAPTGKADLPVLVKQVYSIKTQVSRPREQDQRERGLGSSQHPRAPARRLVPIEEMLPFALPETEWAELTTRGMPERWIAEHTERYIANFENTGTMRSPEEWVSKCRKWLLEDWERTHSPTKRR